MTRVTRRLSAASVLAILCLAVQAPAAVPEGGLDFGMEGLPIPDPMLVNKTTPRTATLLAEAFRDEKVTFRRQRLLHDLGQCRMPEAVPAVVAALGDAEAVIRLGAADAIVILGTDDSRSAASRAQLLNNAEAIAKLKKLTADADPAVRSSAVRALAVIDPAGDAVAAALASTDAALLSGGIDAARTPEQGAVLLGRFATVPATLKARALLAIGRTKPAGAAQQIAQYAAPDLPLPQLAPACQALGMIGAGAGEAMPRLTELLGHKHSVARREAMLAIGPCATPETARKLGVQMLADPDATVRQAAATVLGKVMTAEVVPSLIPILSDGYNPTWKAARDALAQAPAGPARETVIQAAGALLDDADPRRREDGSYLLGQFRSDYKFERHLQLLSEEDPALVAQVAESLGLIGRQEARQQIVALARLADTSAAGKKAMAAANALTAGARLGATELLPDCERILSNDPKFSHHPSRYAAAFTIGCVATPDLPAVDALYRPLGSTMEGVPVKFEAIKALGNLRSKKALGRMENFPMSETHQMKWIVQWATARITGQPEQHPPTPYSWTTETAIRDTTESDQ